MPRLILLCHAKLDWITGSLSDFDRPLSRHGRSDLPIVSKVLLPIMEGDCHLLCSTALRTRQTFALAQFYRPAYKVDFIDKLYEFGVLELLQTVRTTEHGKACLVVIGHDSGLITFLNWCLAASEVTAACNHMPTSTAAVLDLPVPFSELQEGQTRLKAYLPAKALIYQNKETE